jgi:S1-C subfamily serine protease
MKPIPRPSEDSNPLEPDFSKVKKNQPDRSHPLGWQQSLIYLGVGFVGAGAVLLSDRWIDSSAFPQPPQVRAPQVGGGLPTRVAGNRLLATTDPNFISIAVERVGNAVVRIDSARTIARLPDMLNRRFFGAPSARPPAAQIEEGTGSGFIIKSDGLILTNAHVVEGADRVTVTLKDGRTFSGKVLGTDVVTDVAVVKIQASQLPEVTIGNSQTLRSGEWAIAIGNPLGLDNTVTVGIISATGRTGDQIGVPDRRVGFIQTDAAINPGNSGGPLLNQRGAVIGMNTAIIGGAQGLGFAIPINTAQRIANQLIAKGRVEHPYLGIQMATLTPELKAQLNRQSNRSIQVREQTGVLIVGVVANSPAAKAGIQAGDVIQKIGDRSLKKSEEVQQLVENSGVGKNLQIELRRNGKTQIVTIKPEALPARSIH